MSWWSRKWESQGHNLSVAAEAESFLSGRYLETMFDSLDEIPAWAWLSVIAHGDERVLERSEHWLQEHRGARPELDGWGRVLEHVARQLVTTAAAIGCPVTELQRHLLIPLELAVSLTPVGPATLYRLVNAMLSDMSSQSGFDRP